MIRLIPARNRPPGFQSGLKCRKGTTGFSLIELMIVMAVIALMSSIAIPALSGQRAASLTNAGNTLADMVALARQTSLSENSLTLVIIAAKQANAQQSIKMMEYDTLANIWKSSGVQHLPVETQVIDRNPDTTTGGVAQQFAPVTLGNGDVALLFYPDGRLENGSATAPRELRTISASEKNPSVPSNFYDVVINPSTSAFRVSRN